MKKIQKGFTLIELMIVVAIIGILAAVAIPAYQDYIVKAKLSKVTGVIDPVKIAIALYYQEQGSFVAAAGVSQVVGAGWTSLGLSTFPSITNEVGAINMSACTGACDGSSVATSNQLQLTMRNVKAGTIDTNVINMTPTFTGTAIVWANTCTKNSASAMDPIVFKYFNIPLGSC